ncbi:DNA-3-methyladenine glycosylase 2 family protein [Streptomyces sp. SID3343]|uniref:DNA-3-methyladenine glycosylase family protein n=1 Tax=Streptomyces sp. SID3343 TaxID=2690260 RepID=UPI001F1BF02E|nr:DNA-3-methyladenine glycosylase 2 family protein [Streptomyces sp. SID3343]
MDGSEVRGVVHRVWRPGFVLDLHLTAGQLRRGHSDPTYRVGTDGSVWRSSRTPAGPCTLRLLARRGTGEIEASAWGPGAEWQLDAVPELLGAGDAPAEFVAAHPLVRDAERRFAGLRMPRTTLVLAALVPSILEQKVTTIEARRAFRLLLEKYGEPAPGPAPAGLRVVPNARTWALIPSWEWAKAGVDARRSRTVMEATRVAGRLEATSGVAHPEAARLLRLVPGIGVWTAAETMQRSHGDPDALSVGDLHLPKTIGFALAGKAVDDAGMLELLACYAGHRHRAALLIRMSGVPVPRRAPRFAPRTHLARQGF